MELKHKWYKVKANFITLLIVPYGIETLLNYIHIQTSWLLIVPYGIETYINRGHMSTRFDF